MSEERLAYLLRQYITNRCTPTELDEFWALVRASSKSPTFTDHLQLLWNRADDLPPESSAYKEQILSHILSTHPLQKIPKKRRYAGSVLQWAVAASILVVMGLLTYKMFVPPAAPDHPVGRYTKQPKIIGPGSNKAMLRLADGTTLTLDSSRNGAIATESTIHIINQDGQVVYDNMSDGKALSIIYNTMITPKGGQYQLRLSDGTKVWLNASSSITYPVAFNGKDRTVQVSGEAYFEVMKDKTKPFRVDIGPGETVEVLGTHFNVNAYPDEPGATVTLLEGSVRIKQSVLQAGDAYHNGQVFTTDPLAAVAWKDGYFSFYKADLPTVLRQLSRWYNVSFVYPEQTQKRAFSGKIGRNLSLQDVLELLGQARIKYKIENENKIIILP